MNRKVFQDAGALILSQIPGGISKEVEARTPERFAKAWEEYLDGYRREGELQKILTTFEPEGAQHLVAVRNITFFSLCEHHLSPFFGKAHVGYIPNKKIIGASKLPRLVEIFSRRIQLQERITHQVAQTLQEHLDPLGVAVILEGQHMCIAMRGIQKPGSELVTSAMLGVFQNEPAARAEFLSFASHTNN